MPALGLIGLFLLFLSGGAWARPLGAIVLLRADQAGPIIPREIDPHPLWVRWPAPADANGLNRPFSLVTGHDWRIGTDLLAVRRFRDGWRVSGAAAFDRIGVAEARERTFGPNRLRAIPHDDGSYAPLTTPLGAVIGPPGGRDEWWIADARTWDEAREIGRRVPRCVVLDYPPGEGVGHLWRFGTGWPSGTPVGRVSGIPGWLEAREVGAYLTDPARFETVAVPPRPIETWLAQRSTGRVYRWANLAAWAVAAFLAARALSTDGGSRTALVATAVAAALPAGGLGLIGGALLLTRARGIGVLLLAAGLAWPEVSWLTHWFEDAPAAGEPLRYAAAVALVLLGADADRPFPARIAAAGLLIRAVHLRWLSADPVTLAVPFLVALGAGEGWLTARWALLAGASPLPVFDALSFGFDLRPDGLLSALARARATDLGPWLRPAFWAPGLLALIALLAVLVRLGEYGTHRLRRGEGAVFAATAVGTGAACVFTPELAPTLPVVLVATLAVAATRTLAGRTAP